MSSKSRLTPYDTGGRLEPVVWPLLDAEAPSDPDRYGRVDLDDDCGQTVATITSRRQGEGYVIVIEAHTENVSVELKEPS